jgi:Domain of unknown function (DUF1707)
MPTPDFTLPVPGARRGAWPDPGLRVGDAERADIADRLARHFGDGRLDQAEFEQRLDKAMRATTVADLAGLLADLPDGQPLPLPLPLPYPVPAGGLASEAGRRHYQRRMLRLQLEQQRLLVKREQHELRGQRRAGHRHALIWIMAFGAFLVVGYLASRAIAHWFVACLVLGVIAVLLLRRGSGSSGDR